MKKSIAAAVTAAFLTFGAAGVASAAQASDLGRRRPRGGVQRTAAGRRQRAPSHAPHVMECPFSCPTHGPFAVDLTGKLPTSWPCPRCGAESPDVSF